MIENVVCPRCVEPFDTNARVKLGLAAYVCPRCQARMSFFSTELAERVWQRIASVGVAMAGLAWVLSSTSKLGAAPATALAAVGLAIAVTGLAVVLRASSGQRNLRRASTLYDEKLDEQRR